MTNAILSSTNTPLTVTTYNGSTNAAIVSLDGMPLGTANGTATGEVGLKVLVVGGTVTIDASTLATSAKQDTLSAQLPATLGAKTSANSLSVVFATDAALTVSGTFWQTTQPVSIATAPVLVAGSAIIGKVGIDQTTPGTTNAVAVTGTARPALGTATAPSTDVITVARPAVTQVVSTALEASHVLKASAGQLNQLTIFNSKASAQFILLMNSATLPADGAVTLLFPPIPIAAASILVLDIPAPLVASTGIVVCNSSTGTFTKTIGSADCVFYAQVN